MKKHWLILFILVFSSLLFSDSIIKFRKTVIDFGEIESGNSVTANFKFKNEGDNVLQIKKIETSCNCATVQLEKKEYEPGEEGIIPVKFNSYGYKGRISKYVILTTNDHLRKQIKLVIKGDVILKNSPDPIIIPEFIDFGTVNIGKTYTYKLHLKNKGDKDLVLIEIIHSPEIIVAFNEKTVKSNTMIEFEIIFNPMIKGPFRNLIKLRTNYHFLPYIQIPIYAEIIE